MHTHEDDHKRRKNIDDRGSTCAIRSMMVYVCEGEEKERLHECEKEGIHHVRHLPLRLL